MDAIEIEGGLPLSGEVSVSGSKNAALPMIAASLLAPGRSVFQEVPDLADIRTLGRLLGHMGAKVGRGDGSEPISPSLPPPPRGEPIPVGQPASRTFHVDASNLEKAEAPYELVKTMRASVLVLGPLVARFGRARVSLPGGCAIGARPIDQHLKGLEALGAQITLEGGYVIATAKRLKGATILFDLPTVTGTENLMMAAALADGKTVLENCAREPEIIALGEQLRAMGANITGEGTPLITIEGVDELKPANATVIPDRIEAGTLLCAVAIAGGDVLVKRAPVQHLEAALAKLREAGTSFTSESGGLRVRAPARPDAVDVITAPYPGYPTDLQAQLMALLSVAKGASRVVETVFENRFMHVNELQRLGADISVDGHTAVVKGVPRLSGAQVMATDLRASASLVLAGLRAEGKTTVSRVYHLDRGYEGLEKKLTSLGARVRRVPGN
ncbi:MAG: UDP-N-acetylglucosamine 1-carboxyvinyltransferase [Deltaproteobacteria bacterium]|nr:UDP-N-acetylglucosamine 1-carboxyvinyltransferase [Deltaproteobacteria bacterium]